MSTKRTLAIAAAVACVAIGLVAAHQYDRHRNAARIVALQEQQRVALDQARNEADARADAVARSQGEVVLQAFVAGISPAVLADSSENVELAAVQMLRLTGVAGIHVLEPTGTVMYSSDAKLSETNEGAYRGSWAMGARALISRPSERAGVIDIAVPIMGAGEPHAIAWLEYDVAAVKTAATSGAMHGAVDDTSVAKRLSSRERPAEGTRR